MDQKQKDSIIFKLLLFIFSPFLSLIVSFIDLKSRVSQLIILQFGILFGLNFIVQNKSFDSYRVLMKFNEYCLYPSLIKNNFNEYFTFKSDIKDLYLHLILSIVSYFTSNYHLLFALFAFVFGFFNVKSLSILLQNERDKLNLFVLIIVFFFMQSNLIFNINGVRFWTASWIYVFLVFCFVYKKKYIYIILQLFLPLVHFSYFCILPITLLSLFLKKRLKFLLVIFVLSFIFSSFNKYVITSLNDYLPIFIQQKIWSYTESDSVLNYEILRQSQPLYARILNSLPFLFINFSTFIVVFGKMKKFLNVDLYIVSFVILLVSFSNFTYSVISLGGRFMMVSPPLLALLFVNNYKNNSIIRFLVFIIPLVYAYQTFQMIRFISTIIDPILLVFPLPFQILYHINV